MADEALRTPRRDKGQRLPGFLGEDAAGERYIGFDGWRAVVAAPVLEVTFYYSLDGRRGRGEEFEARLTYHGLEADELAGADVDAAPLRELFFAQGMSIAAWLFMEHPRRRLRVLSDADARAAGRAGAAALTSHHVAFWNATLKGGLLEYLWINRLPFALTVEPWAGGDGGAAPPAAPARGAVPAGPPKEVVPLGGGKDSLTVLELLRDAGVPTADQMLFYFTDSAAKEWERNWRVQALWRASEVPRFVRCEFDLPAQARCPPCAHVEDDGSFHLLFDDDDAGGARPAVVPGLVPSTPPWAAMVCFAAAAPALLGGHAFIAVGNERSANYGNGVAWLGDEVNHQYDKGFRWERAAHEYLRDVVLARSEAPLHYFSALMHLWETQIASRFCRTHDRGYLRLFLSCNTPVGDPRAASAAHASRWCNGCAKCAFVFLLLSAHAQPAEVMGVFGDNLFYYAGLQPLFRQLLGVGSDAEKKMKPLDCVGTKEEARLSLLLAHGQYARSAFAPPPALEALVAALHRELPEGADPFLDELPRLLKEYLPPPGSAPPLPGTHLLPGWLSSFPHVLHPM
eukprot:TRINITY_DN4067_c0_g1_i1.p1 TRINITY_DN4067_c0_g1~~TRINITY_DN4067_c0_g1_i1.p1  ORF type:complete len:588 (+),score=173.45 TRINITY_DN4067_c0_g1_i1:56-1765(+)